MSDPVEDKIQELLREAAPLRDLEPEEAEKAGLQDLIRRINDLRAVQEMEAKPEGFTPTNESDDARTRDLLRDLPPEADAAEVLKRKPGRPRKVI